jgi:hypothetical protein
MACLILKHMQLQDAAWLLGLELMLLPSCILQPRFKM